ncbi:MAG: DUF3347 domain-containing protein [Ginsengibacter sp.]
MKNIIFAFAISAISLTACNNSSDKTTETNTTPDNPAPVAQTATASASPVSGLLQTYLKMKNDFAKDDDKGAADAGNQMLKEFNDFDQSSLNDADKKAYNDIKDDAKEHAEHIGMNAGNIKHQREHFDMLSKDMYDLVKKFGAGEKIYVDFCPMYNDNKGATWLSETKEITNPYFGKGMNTCGTVKEELN